MSIYKQPNKFWKVLFIKCEKYFFLSLDNPPRQKYLVLVNPFGGKGTALKLFETEVKPMLEEADVCYELNITSNYNYLYLPEFYIKPPSPSNKSVPLTNEPNFTTNKHLFFK